jgi:hypothetical protein
VWFLTSKTSRLIIHWAQNRKVNLSVISTFE